MYSLIKVNGYPMYLTGRTGNQLIVSNGIQLVLSYDEAKYIKDLLKINQEEFDQNRLENLGINKFRNEKLYDTLNKKYTNEIYKKRPNSMGNKMIEWKNTFQNLSIKDQTEVLLQLIQLGQKQNSGVNLEKLGASKKTGVSLVSKKITDKESFELINKSITGLYENKVDLLRV